MGEPGGTPSDNGDGAGTGRLGELVRQYRCAAGLTQERLAYLAGVSLGALRDLEQGRTSRPRPSSVRRLAGSLGLDQAGRRELLATLLATLPATPEPGPGVTAARDGAGPDRLEVLGPLTVWRNGTAITLGPGRQRAVLGLLAINPGVTMHRDTVIDALWGQDPPATAVAMVQAYVSRLRRILHAGRSPAATLQTTGAGYRLHAGEQLDLHRFTQATRRAATAHSTADAATACQLYEQALQLWQGDPLADLELLRTHPTVHTLRQRRTTTIMGYAQAACALGDPSRALPLLSELAAADPLDERVHAHLMIALAGTGQQAAALTVYQQLTARLDRELGVQPSAELTRAHQRVLHQDLPTGSARTSRPAHHTPAGPLQPASPNRVRLCRRRLTTRP